jgi:hypothetical protein
VALHRERYSKRSTSNATGSYDQNFHENLRKGQKDTKDSKDSRDLTIT